MQKDAELKELEALIELAEKTSVQVRIYMGKLSRIRVLFLLSIILLFASILFAIMFPMLFDEFNHKFSIYMLIVGVVFFLGLLVIIVRMLFEYVSLSRVARHEKELLRKLLSMTHEVKLLHDANDLSRIERAIIEMRLSRIHFSINDNS